MKEKFKDNWDDKTRNLFVMEFIHNYMFPDFSAQDTAAYADALMEIMLEKGVNIDSFKCVSEWLSNGCHNDFKDCDELYDLMDKKVREILMRNVVFEFSLGE